MFKIHSNGKIYEVRVRGAYAKTITSERRLLIALTDMSNGQRNPKLGEALNAKLDAGRIHEVCEYFGILVYSAPIEK